MTKPKAPVTTGPARVPTSPLAAVRAASARALGTSAGATRAAPHIRAVSSVDRVLLQFVIASLPALLIGVWSAGSVATAAITRDGVDAGSLLYRVLVDVSMLEIGQIPGSVSVLLGAALFVPVLITALVTSLFWAWVFAAARARPLDAGWLLSAWLYALLMPPTVPLYLVVMGLSFGAVIGMHAFGGTGRYLVSPALLGALVVQIAYPSALLGDALGPDAFASTWILGVREASDTGALAGPWWPPFLGLETGAFGTPSALACYLGAAYLCYRRVASLRIVAGAVVAAIVVALAIEALAGPEQAPLLPWYGHLSLGSFAFAVAFLATDPTTSPTTRTGRWIFGALLGALTVSIRQLADTHPEGSLTAVMLAALTIPLIDHLAVLAYIRRRRQGARA